MDRFVRWIGRVNEWVGRVAGLLIVAVVVIIVREVIARGAFNAPSLWADESMTYLAGMAYALGGGFTYLHRKHVAVDLVYQRVAERGGTTKHVFDVLGFGFFAIYCLTLIWFEVLLCVIGFLCLSVDLRRPAAGGRPCRRGGAPVG